MVLLNNINQFIFSQSQSGKNIIEIHFFKNKAINLLLIKDLYFKTIFDNKNLNSLDIFYISLNNSYIELITREENAVFSTLNSLCVQKSNKYKNFKEGYTSFNIVSYKLNNIWKSENFFKKGDNFRNVAVFSDFIGNKISLTNSVVIAPLLEFVETNLNSSVDLNNLLYFTEKDYVFGYKNKFERKISYIPLLRPVPNLKITFKNKNENKSKIIDFVNNNYFNVNFISLQNGVLNEQTVSTKTVRLTSGDIIDDNDSNIKNETYPKFEVITCKIEESFNIGVSTAAYYNVNYNVSPMYDLKVNIFTIKFLNNYSIITQKYNEIVINKETNNNLSNLLTTNVNTWFDWDTPGGYQTQTNDSYFKLKVIGITESRLAALNLSNLQFKLLIKNNNSNVVNLYLQNKSYRQQTNTSGLYSGFKSIRDDYGFILLKNSAFELIPIPFSTSAGLFSLISFTVVESNSNLFDDLIIDNVVIKIAGLKSSVNKVIINLNLKSNLGYTTYSSPIVISSINDQFYDQLRIEDVPVIVVDGENTVDVPEYHKEFRSIVDEYQGKNPIIKDNPLLLTLTYFVTFSGNNIIFKRVTTDDKTIDSNFINSNSLITDICDNFLTQFNPKENDTLYFDMKESQNLGKTIKFYKDQSCQNELMNEETFITEAEYSRNHIPGEEGSYIRLVVPENDDSRLINSTIYYKIISLNDLDFTDNSTLVGKIKIQNRKKLHHSEISVASINNITNNSGLLTYSNSLIDFYDPTSTRERYGLKINNTSSNYYLIENNYFNNYDFSFNNVFVGSNSSFNKGFLELDISNSNVFIGDNLFFLQRLNNISSIGNPTNVLSTPFFSLERRFYFKNDNLIEGRIRMGFINSSTYSTPSDFITNAKNIDSSLIETLNTNNSSTDYIVYVVSSSGTFVKATNVTGTQSPYTVSHTGQSCNINITEDELGRISHTYHGSSVPTDLQIAYIRKKFSFNIAINMTNTEITDAEVFFFEPLDYDANKNNYDLSNNKYLIAFTYTETNQQNIGFFTVSLTHDEPYYIIDTNSYRKILFFPNANPYIFNKNQPVSGNNFSLKDASGQMIIDKYNSFSLQQQQQLNSRTDSLSSVLSSSWSINNFTLPIIDLFKKAVFSIEIYYYYRNNEDYISYKLVKSNTNGFTVIDSDTIVKSSDINNYNAFLTELYAVDVNSEGNIIFITPGTKPDLLSNSSENTLNNNYMVCLQVENYKNNSFINRLSNFKIFNNFENGEELGLFGLAGTNTLIQQTCLNTKKVAFPLTYPEKIIQFLKDKIEQINTAHPGTINTTHDISNETITIIDNSLNYVERYKYSNQDISKNNIIRDLSNAIQLNGGTMSYYDISSSLFNASFTSFIQDNNINIIKNKQPPVRISELSFENIKVDVGDLSKTGTGIIRYFTKEYNNLNENIVKGSYNKIHGNDIIFNVVDVDNISNLKNTIFNESHVLLEWQHENDNLSVEIVFRIYRTQGSGTDNYKYLAETKNKNYTDTTAIPYLVTKYRIDTIIKWDGQELLLESSNNVIQAFLCQNNQFPFGRYSSNINPKLYYPLGNSQTCAVNQKKTGNLFPNSMTLTKKQVYSELSRAKNRPFR